MIRPGDRLLLGLSGGKDSLSLLQVLRTLQVKSPVKFDLACATVDPCIDGYDPYYLNAYLEGLGIPYFYRRQAIVARALKTMRGDSFSPIARAPGAASYDIARTEATCWSWASILMTWPSRS
jgi:tRNA(Ile)-lysidine synthase TilS/MesJ